MKEIPGEQKKKTNKVSYNAQIKNDCHIYFLFSSIFENSFVCSVKTET